MRPFRNDADERMDDDQDPTQLDPKTDYEPPEEENLNQPGDPTGQG